VNGQRRSALGSVATVYGLAVLENNSVIPT
jgi:hypothetical protein